MYPSTRDNAYVNNESYKLYKRRFCKCLTLLAQQAQVSTTTLWRETKKLHLLPYKIGQVQTVEEGDYKRHLFHLVFVDCTSQSS